MKTLGEKIAYLRKEKKISQEALGLEIGVSRSAIVKWEKDIMRPNHESLNLLCEFFKVDANYFFEDEYTDKTQNICNEIAISKIESKPLNLKYIILLILFLLIFIVSLIITIVYGLSLFSTNTGFTSSSTTSFNDVIFYIGLCVSIFSLIIVIITIIKIKKQKK